jgi:TPR repeat protein
MPVELRLNSILRSLTSVIVAVLLSVSSVFAGAFEDAVVAYDQKDYATALRLFQSLAEQGDAKAQGRLGFMYFQGQGVPKDDAEAAKWLRRAAEHGDAYDQFAVGAILRVEGAVHDDAEAAKWLRRTAEQGNVLSQAMLSLMYDRGEGVPQDYVLAYMWFNLSAADANAEAGEVAEIARRYGFELGEVRKAPLVKKYRDELAAKMTPDQIAEAQRLARQWKPTN